MTKLFILSLLLVGCAANTQLTYSDRGPLPEGERATIMVNSEWHEDLAIHIVPLNSSLNTMIGIAQSPTRDRWNGLATIHLHCWTLPPLDSVKFVAINSYNEIIAASEPIYIPDATSWTWIIADWSRRIKRSSTHCVRSN
jgi:hypothetical protein